MLGRFFRKESAKGYSPSVIAPRVPSPHGTAGKAPSAAAKAARKPRSSGSSRWWLVPVLGAAGAVFGMGIYYGYIELVKSRWFALVDVQVEGADRLGAEQIVEALGLQSGGSILDVKEDELESRVLTNLGWIRRVDVTRDMPSTLVVKVEERKAEAILADRYTCLVDNDGVVFKVMEPEEYRKEFIVLSGLAYYDLVDQQMMGMAKDRVSEALALSRDYASKHLSEFVALKEVQFDEAIGYTLVGEGGQQVVMGFGRHSDKMLWLAAIVDFLKKEQATFDTVYMDNERRPEQVVVTGTGLAKEPLTLDFSRRVSGTFVRPLNAAAKRQDG